MLVSDVMAACIYCLCWCCVFALAFLFSALLSLSRFHPLRSRVNYLSGHPRGLPFPSHFDGPSAQSSVAHSSPDIVVCLRTASGYLQSRLIVSLSMRFGLHTRLMKVEGQTGCISNSVVADEAVSYNRTFPARQELVHNFRNVYWQIEDDQPSTPVPQEQGDSYLISAVRLHVVEI